MKYLGKKFAQREQTDYAVLGVQGGIVMQRYTGFRSKWLWLDRFHIMAAQQLSLIAPILSVLYEHTKVKSTGKKFQGPEDTEGENIYTLVDVKDVREKMAEMQKHAKVQSPISYTAVPTELLQKVRRLWDATFLCQENLTSRSRIYYFVNSNEYGTLIMFKVHCTGKKDTIKAIENYAFDPELSADLLSAFESELTGK